MMVTFGKPATYGGRKQIEATIGAWPEQRRLVLRQAERQSVTWDVSQPEASSTSMHGVTSRRGGGTLMRGLTLRQAKAFAAEWLESRAAEVDGGMPMADDNGTTR